MGKKCFLIAIILFLILGFNVSVDAESLNKKSLTVECIYSDGSLIISSSANGKISVSRETSQIVTDNEADANEIAEYYIVNPDTVINDSGSCRPYIVTAAKSQKMYQQECDTDGNCSNVGDPYWATVAYYKTIDTESGTLTNDEVNNTKSWWDWFTSDEEYGNSEVKNTRTYKLVSEKIFVEDADLLDKATPCYFVKKATQASGTNTYLTLFLFDNITLVDNNGLVTSLGNKVVDSCPADGTVIYVNDPFSKIDVSKSSPKYFYDAVRFGYSDKKGGDYQTKYEKTSEVPPNDGESGKNACEEIPETIKVLKRIITILQIGVPIFVILLTSIDIFRIVVAGNVEEELPKRKKSIIVRLIITVIFFFLPLIVNIGLRLLYNSSDWFRKEVGINSIDCLILDE